MISRGARAIGLGLVVAALAACTGGDANGPRPDQSLTPTADAEAPHEVLEPATPGPLEVYAGYGESPQTPQEMAAELTRQENSVAACMADQGFEYTPQVPAVDEITATEGPIPGTRSFVEDYGYGIWASPAGDTGGGFTYTHLEDPNGDRREAMTEAGRQAYDTALWGPVIEAGDDGSITRGGGCFDVAMGWAVADDPYLAGVLADAYAFPTAIGDDSRFGDVDAAWASCMADAGFSFRTPSAAQQQFIDAASSAYVNGIGPDRAVVAQNALEERSVAVADLDCQEATDWAARHRAIEIELQQEYVDAHRADLDALAEAMSR